MTANRHAAGDESDPRRYRPFGARREANRGEVRMTVAIILIVAVVVLVVAAFLVGRSRWLPSRNKRCSRCGQRTPLKSEVCEHCGYVFHVRETPGRD
jgi:uncharacterized paraquat-inducible protein A